VDPIIKARLPSPSSEQSTKYKKIYYYELTDKGFDLLPVIMDLAQWSWKHVPGSFSPPAIKRLFKQDRRAFMAEWKKKIKTRSKAYRKAATST